MKNLITLAVLSASLPVSTMAQTERDLDSHVHGAASLNVAIVESSVFIELNTPWNNLVGFEHAPQTDEQRASVETALAQLNDPAQVLSFDGGGCTIDEVMVESSMSGDEHGDEHHDDHGDEHHDEHGEEHHDDHNDDHGDEHHDDHADADSHDHDDKHEDEHAHADSHDDEHGDEHDHAESHDHDEHAEDTHTTVMVSYSFGCTSLGDLNAINLSLFSVWSGFEELDVQLIGDNGQAFVELDPGNTVLDVSQVR